MQIRVGRFCSFLRQEGRENLETHILLISVAVGAPLNHANLVIQSFDKAQLDLVAGRAVRHDPVPVPFDQGGKPFKGAEPLPLELLPPAGEELARPPLPAIGPELAEFFFEQVGRGQALVGAQQLLQGAAPSQCEIGAVGEERVPLALDEGPVLRRHAVILGATDLIHRVSQMTQDVELVKEDLGLRCVRLDRVAERLPHVHHRQPNAGRLLGAQVEKEPVQVGFSPALPSDPDRAAALQVAHDDAIRVALLDRQFIHTDHMRGWRRRLSQPGLHIVSVQGLNGMLMQVQ